MNISGVVVSVSLVTALRRARAGASPILSYLSVLWAHICSWGAIWPCRAGKLVKRPAVHPSSSDAEGVAACRAVPEPRVMLLRQVLVAVLASTASAFVVSPRPTAPTLSAVAEVRTAAPQMFLG